MIFLQEIPEIGELLMRQLISQTLAGKPKELLVIYHPDRFDTHREEIKKDFQERYPHRKILGDFTLQAHAKRRYASIQKAIHITRNPNFKPTPEKPFEGFNDIKHFIKKIKKYDKVCSDDRFLIIMRKKENVLAMIQSGELQANNLFSMSTQEIDDLVKSNPPLLAKEVFLTRSTQVPQTSPKPKPKQETKPVEKKKTSTQKSKNVKIKVNHLPISKSANKETKADPLSIIETNWVKPLENLEKDSPRSKELNVLKEQTKQKLDKVITNSPQQWTDVDFRRELCKAIFTLPKIYKQSDSVGGHKNSLKAASAFIGCLFLSLFFVPLIFEPVRHVIMRGFRTETEYQLDFFQANLAARLKETEEQERSTPFLMT